MINDKIKRFSIVILIILIFFISSCENQKVELKDKIDPEKENIYVQAMEYADNKQYGAAKRTLENVKGYKDSDDLIIKMEENIALEAKELEQIKDAKKYYKENLLGFGNRTSKVLQIIEFKKIIGNYEDYQTRYNLDAKTLTLFANLLDMDDKEIKDKFVALKYASIISPKQEVNETGDIMQFISMELEHYNIDDEEWQLAYENSNSIGLYPYIGMTKTELLLSTWGKPEKINRTITANTIYEQWCYYKFKYIYLENDIVVTIQD